MEQQNQTPVQVSEKIDNIDQQTTGAKDSYTPIENYLLAKDLPTPIQVVQTAKEEQEVYELWVGAYKKLYPDYEVCRDDPQNTQAHILYARDEKGKVASSARLTIDSPLGMPSDEYYPPEVAMYREQGNKLMEYGRFVSNGGNLALLKTYYKAVYQVAKAENIDIIIMTMKQKDVAFHSNLIGAYLLLSDMGIQLGGQYKMSCVAWEIKHTKSRFFRWTGLNKQTVQQTIGEIA